MDFDLEQVVKEATEQQLVALGIKRPVYVKFGDLKVDDEFTFSEWHRGEEFIKHSDLSAYSLYAERLIDFDASWEVEVEPELADERARDREES